MLKLRSAQPAWHNDDGNSVLIWMLRLQRDLDAETQQAVSSALGRLQSKIQRKAQAEYQLSVTGEDHEHAWDQSMCALLLLEQHGEVITIQGEDRNTKPWKMNIEFAEQAGAFESFKSDLMRAAAKADAAQARILLDAPNCLEGIDKVSLSGRTPLLYALQTKDWPTVEVLLSHGANAGVCGRECFDLQYATTLSLNAVQTLLSAGASVNKQSRYRETALMHAAASGSAEVVQFLIERGADCRVLDSEGKSALDWAQHRAEIKALIESKMKGM
jgi:hypothetical protein